MSENEPCDPFTSKGVLSLPPLNPERTNIWPDFRNDHSYQSNFLALADPVSVKLEPLVSDTLQLSTEHIPLPVVKTSPQVSTASFEDVEAHALEPQQSETVDLWTCVDIAEPSRHNKISSWNNFVDNDYQEPTVAYISEGGPSVFDALLHNLDQDGDASVKTTQFAKVDRFVIALLDLGVGRGSDFFVWDTDKRLFNNNGEEYKVSGFSKHSIDQLIASFLDHGTKHRRLEERIHSKAYQDATRLAFSGAINTILTTVEEAVNNKRSHTYTLLQVQELFYPIKPLTSTFYQMMQILDEKQSLGSQLKRLITYTEDTVLKTPDTEKVLEQALAQTFQPAIEAAATKIGFLNTQSTLSKELTNALDQVLPTSITNTMISTEASLKLLHEAVGVDLALFASTSRLHQLWLDFSLDRACLRQDQANIYENQVKNRLLKLNQLGRGGHQKPSLFDEFVSPSTKTLVVSDPFSLNLDLFEKAQSIDRNAKLLTQTALAVALQALITENSVNLSQSYVPCSKALELSLTPMVMAQYRLVSYASIQSLFTYYNITQHLESLFRFQLLGDGPFTLRISEALFDSQQRADEGRRAITTQTGLRLQSRDSWPPASSELRLVLMGILSESMSNIDDLVVHSTSFAIRDLSDEELELCKNVHTIHALDFLRLHYKPPNPMIASIITPKALNRYDKIFIHLLRLLRVKDLTQYLLRRTCTRYARLKLDHAEHKFRREIQHFIFALANYTQNIAITSNWLTFQGNLHSIKERTREHDYEGTLEIVSGIDHLREQHETALANICGALMLRKKQSESRKLMEDIFNVILEYAATFQPPKSTLETSHEYLKVSSTTQRLHNIFRSKARAFVAHLKTIIAQGIGAEAEMAEQLLLALDFGGFYSKDNK